MTAVFHFSSLSSVGLNAIAQTSAVQIVDCLVEGTLIAIFAGLVLRMARRQNSGTRFAVWFSALMAIAALPLFGGAWWSQVGSPAKAVGSVITLRGSWALYAVIAWAAIAAWSLLGVARSLWHLHLLRKSCLPVDTAGLDRRLQETLERNRATRPVALCTSDRVRVPTAIGFMKPVVVVPGWVMQELSADELNQILLHELAHLRRWDDWTNLAQKVVRALFFLSSGGVVDREASIAGTRDGVRRCRDRGDCKPARLCGMPHASGRKDFRTAQHGAGTSGIGTNSAHLASSGSDSGCESAVERGARLEARGVAGGGVRHGLCPERF